MRPCVQAQETVRIAKLNATPAFRPDDITEYKITGASQTLDFLVRIFAKKEPASDDSREGPGRALIFAKGQSTPLQTIAMDNMFMSLDKKGNPLTNSANLYENQGFVNAGDFNFDGHEDFGIQNGNNGAYQGPSYDIYLYPPEKKRFELSKPMTNLIAGSLGFFQIVPSKKMLTTLSKEGCCYHTTTTYAVAGNIPNPVSRIIEDATKSDRYVLVNQQQRESGKWKQISTKRIPQEKN